jgi:uncharacterized protein (TIGR04551 family)
MGEPAPGPALPQVQLPAGPALPDPNEASAKLAQTAPPPPVEKKWWRLPETMFHLHGYFRLRGNVLNHGNIGHSAQFDRLPGYDNGSQMNRTNYDPFIFFSPADSHVVTSRVQSGSGGVNANSTQEPIGGGCGKHSTDTGGGQCNKNNETFGDMRLRIKPEVHLSDDIRVKGWIDVLNNVGLGSQGFGGNNLTAKNVARVRRIWGEARNRDLGELRFGRMGADWGLGILDNGGDRYGIDSDFSSDVDRVQVISNLAGYYLMAAYDWDYEGWSTPGSSAPGAWSQEGWLNNNNGSPSGITLNRSTKDDINAVTLAAAHRLDPDVQQSALMRGDSVFNYGLYFVWRKQFLQWNPAYQQQVGMDLMTPPYLFSRLNQKQYIPDLWLQFLQKGLRIELEATFVAGGMEGGCPRLIGSHTENPNNYEEAIATTPNVVTGAAKARPASGTCKFRQFGIALESEYRLFDDRLGIYFFSGLATGDSQGYGLAYTNDPLLQRTANDSPSQSAPGTASTYQFHPDYRVDLILWRTIMRRIAGGYYFKPGVSYDFIRDSFGQRAGGRLDLIYSRATNPRQTWGDNGNLGLEVDLSLYYRSADGPDPMDGFYGLIQGGLLFPLAGLGYNKDEQQFATMAAPKTHLAILFRAVVGIAF